ncbi:MAG: hypothetical protein IKD37_06450 [Clostridia bacterium]|nr:hypothetical protein [Clostridia bacterium]
MNQRYKQDWEQARARIEAFWQGEVLDRCCIAIRAGQPAAPVPQDEAGRLLHWTDPNYIIARERARMEKTHYGGEAFPCIFLNLGAAGHAGFFRGARYTFENSVWFSPSTDDPDTLAFDESSFLYRKTLELAQAFAADSNGDYFVSMPDSTGNLDALSHLLGPDELLPTMLEEPERLSAALEKVQSAYARVMREVYATVRTVNDGGSCIDWLSTWAPGFHAQMQCDMSVMISNAMFDEFAMPELRAQCDLLDYPLYHLDGAEQLRHLDSLLSLEKLRAIQWMQVAGQKPCTEYIPELQKIQAAGKNLVIIVSPRQVKPLMENLSSRGLFLVTRTGTQDEAEALLRDVERWTHL